MSRQSRFDEDGNAGELANTVETHASESNEVRPQMKRAGTLLQAKGRRPPHDARMRAAPVSEAEASNPDATVRRFHPVEIVGSCEDLFRDLPGSSPLAQTVSTTSGTLPSSTQSVRSEKCLPWDVEKENQIDSGQEMSPHLRLDKNGPLRADGRGHSLRRLFR